MTKRYSTCQTVGELREALSGIPDDVALFGDVEEDRYVSVTVDLDKVAGNAVCLEPGPPTGKWTVAQLQKFAEALLAREPADGASTAAK